MQRAWYYSNSLIQRLTNNCVEKMYCYALTSLKLWLKCVWFACIWVSRCISYAKKMHLARIAECRHSRPEADLRRYPDLPWPIHDAALSSRRFDRESGRRAAGLQHAHRAVRQGVHQDLLRTGPRVGRGAVVEPELGRGRVAALGELRADNVKMEQVLCNLVSNAIKFASLESRVIVRTLLQVQKYNLLDYRN